MYILSNLIIVFFLFWVILRQGLTYPRLSSNSLCSQKWLLIFLPLPPLQVLRLDLPTTMPSLCSAEDQSEYFVNARSALCQLSFYLPAHLPLCLLQQVMFSSSYTGQRLVTWSFPFSISHCRCLIAVQFYTGSILSLSTFCSIISSRVSYNMFGSSSSPPPKLFRSSPLPCPSNFASHLLLNTSALIYVAHLFLDLWPSAEEWLRWFTRVYTLRDSLS